MARKKRPRGKRKGTQFERIVCQQLSRWWTRAHGKRDDVFWRTSISGGRATARGRRGLSTHGSYGDVAAVDPIGEPLIQTLVIEIKRGYNRASPLDLLDYAPGAAQQVWEQWYQQAEQACTLAKAFSWLVIIQRDKRTPLVMFPDKLITIAGEDPELSYPCLKLASVIFRIDVGRSWYEHDEIEDDIWVMQFDDFLRWLTPKAVGLAYKKRRVS